MPELVAERMLRKVQEAQFFLRRMRDERVITYPMEEVDAMEFFLHAFLSAAKSVGTIVEVAGFKSWLRKWRKRPDKADRDLLKFVADQRNTSQHQGKIATFEVELQEVPLPAHGYARQPGHVETHYNRPGPRPKQTVTRRNYTFPIAGNNVDLDEACEGCLALLDLLIADFIADHPTP